MTNERWLLAATPKGLPQESDFRRERAEVRAPGEGEILVEVHWVSVDPYLRGRVTGVRTYIGGFAPGDLIEAGGVGRVVESRSPDFTSGDWVEGMLGWQRYAALPAKMSRKLDPAQAPVETALGVLGMPGLTAYFGLLELGTPKPGETLVVSGAAGAVGCLVGQIGRIRGCRVVGIAGGPEKARWLREDLRFDAAIDYKRGDLDPALAAACPQGVDVYFDNVGGAISDAIIPRINLFARIVICGQISQYNLTQPESGPRHWSTLLVRQARAEGFIVTRFFDRAAEGIGQLAAWLRSGELRWRETVVDGFENTPGAFVAMLTGGNIGKMLVRIRP